MGRAGAGGYATVQHAYDTRLKRDVAIKCIKINKNDITRARMSIHDAQIEGASIALPSTSKLGGYLSPRYTNNDKSYSQNNSLEQQQTQPNTYQQKRNNSNYDGDFARNVLNKGSSSNAEFGSFVSIAEKISEPSFLATREKQAAKREHRRNLIRTSARPGVDAQSFDTKTEESTSFDIGSFADALPGEIAGAGKANIDGIGDDVINFEEDTIEHDNARPYLVEDTSSQNRQQRLKIRRAYESVDNEKSSENERTEDPLAGARFIPGLEEARTAAHLNDANIVTVYDCVVDGDMAYVIMEYVEGKTLARIMRDLGNDITLDMVASVFSSVAHALEVAHKAGVLHLDIKPENVIINNEGIVKVTDFGLSTLMDASGHGETGGGTIGYMPLEQMRQESLDVRTDEWALASLTYEMLTGKNPFKARNLRDAADAIEGAELVVPSRCWAEIDPRIDDVMFSALSPDMQGRYASIEEFSSDLMPFLGDAREGKPQLARAVSDNISIHRETFKDEKEKEPRYYVPFIDKLGVRGSNILMRLLSACGVAMIVAVALINFRFPVNTEDFVESMTQTNGLAAFGLFDTAPVAAWIILALIVALGAILPRFAMPVAYLVLVIMMFYNQAWLLGILLLLATGAWWWFFGRQSDMMCTIVMLEPLFGSVGFASAIASVTGALLDIKDAASVVLMSAFTALMFASFGSLDITNWDIINNYIVAINPEIAGDSMTSGLISSLTSPQNWIVIASWVAAACIFSLFCRKGTHVFDILGSIVCAVCIIVGAVIFPICSGNLQLLTPIALFNCVVAAIVGIVLALISVTDRVRMAPGEW